MATFHDQKPWPVSFLNKSIFATVTVICQLGQDKMKPNYKVDSKSFSTQHGIYYFIFHLFYDHAHFTSSRSNDFEICLKTTQRAYRKRNKGNVHSESSLINSSFHHEYLGQTKMSSQFKLFVPFLIDKNLQWLHFQETTCQVSLYLKMDQIFHPKSFFRDRQS